MTALHDVGLQFAAGLGVGEPGARPSFSPQWRTLPSGAAPVATAAYSAVVEAVVLALFGDADRHPAPVVPPAGDEP